MVDGDLSGEELERLAILAVGLALGFLLFSLAAYLVEEWVIASDQADRRRIREILREMLDGGRDLHDQEHQASELQRRSLTQTAVQ